MGIWSHESFGNDDACEFAEELAGTKDLSVAEEALDVVLETGDAYLDASEASRAIVAAETLSRLQGAGGKRNVNSKALDSWVEKASIWPSQALIQKADQALDRILTDPSELKDLWGESGESDKWIDAVKELKIRVLAQSPHQDIDLVDSNRPV